MHRLQHAVDEIVFRPEVLRHFASGGEYGMVDNRERLRDRLQYSWKGREKLRIFQWPCEGGDAMPSPFPGMNPYIERASVWHDFHERWIPFLDTA